MELAIFGLERYSMTLTSRCMMSCNSLKFKFSSVRNPVGFREDEAWQFFHSNNCFLGLSKRTAEIDFTYNSECFCVFVVSLMTILRELKQIGHFIFKWLYFCSQQFCQFIFPGEKSRVQKEANKITWFLGYIYKLCSLFFFFERWNITGRQKQPAPLPPPLPKNPQAIDKIILRISLIFNA